MGAERHRGPAGPAVAGSATRRTAAGVAVAVGLFVAACGGGSSSVTGPGTTVKFASLSVGSGSACGVATGGAGFCWGNNSVGQLGNGSFTASSTPVAVAGGQTVTSLTVSLGGGFACGLASGSAAYCWGNNDAGQLGNGATTNSSTPVAVAGETFACGVTTTNAAYCWGENSAGNLGTGSTTSSSTPVAVAGTLVFQQVSGGTNYPFACAVTTSGAAYCWGWNTFGQLGTGSATGPAVCNGYACSMTPVAVVGGYTFRAVSAGGSFACGIATTGVTYCWGLNTVGQLGDSATANSATPVAVAGGHAFTAVSAGGAFACGLTAAGAAYCWGSNTTGQLGDSTQASRIVPVAVKGGYSFATLSAGNLSACGLTTTGVAYCWGNNTQGELGTGTVALSTVPTKVANQP